MEVSGTLVVHNPKPKAVDRELPWVLNLPAPGSKASSCGVLLTHGAGGDLNSGVLPQVAAALAAAGVPVLRFTCKPVHLQTRCTAMRVCAQN
jgi:predicted alpha/beta-hydrolase family hydrolase